jgi:hypothetical protein
VNFEGAGWGLGADCVEKLGCRPVSLLIHFLS